MTKSKFSLKWIGDPSRLIGLGQLTTVDYPVANYIRQGAPRTIWLTNDCGPHNRPLSEIKKKNMSFDGINDMHAMTVDITI